MTTTAAATTAATSSSSSPSSSNQPYRPYPNHRDELAFRLGSLHRLYPAVVTAEILSEWLGQARRGTPLRLLGDSEAAAAFREQQDRWQEATGGGEVRGRGRVWGRGQRRWGRGRELLVKEKGSKSHFCLLLLANFFSFCFPPFSL